MCVYMYTYMYMNIYIYMYINFYNLPSIICHIFDW